MADVVQVAKQIRKELKEKFPFAKFSVRSSRYSGGSSVHVSWTDFPTQEAVEEITSKYKQVRYDEYTREILSGGNLFVIAQNKWSDELRNKIETEMKNNYSESYLSDPFGKMKAFNETAEKLYNEFLQTLGQPKEAKQEQQTDVKATYTLNEELNGIEITFTGVPSEEVRNELKTHGFRWSKYKKVWYAKQTAERLEFAKMLAGETEEQTEEVAEQSEAQQEIQQTETQTETVTEQTEIQQEPQQAEERLQKIKAKSITFLWSESPIIKNNTTVSTWEEANRIVKDIAFRKDTGGYDKTAFRIEWEDNSTYEGRIDVQASDLYKNAPLSDHIENFALTMAGMKKPTGYTQEEYENLLNAYNSDREAWKEFLDSYMLHDDETPKSPIDPSDQSGKHNNNAENSEMAAIVTETTQPLQEKFVNIDNNQQEKVQGLFSIIPEVHENALDLQFFSNQTNTDDILNLFDTIDLTQEKTLISDEDREHINKYEESYRATLSVFENTLQQLKALYGQFGDDNKTYDSYSFICRYNDIRDIEERINKLKDNFISKVCYYFINKYNVTIDYESICKKYDTTVTAQNILDEIIEQLDGFSFVEKAQQEIKQQLQKETAYNKPVVKGNKLTLSNFFYLDQFDLKFESYKLSYNSYDRAQILLKALYLYEYNITQLTEEAEELYKTFRYGKNDDVFTTHELNMKKVKSIKLYKNGRVDIKFTTNDYAKQFYNEYLQ